MKLSTKGRYGLMAMHRLSLNYGKGPVSLKFIAKEENLSEAYLEQLFSILKKNKLIESIRGAQGGYLLSRPPEKIKIGEILTALEGELELACCSGKDVTECDKELNCATKNVLDKLQTELEGVFNSLTLADM